MRILNWNSLAPAARLDALSRPAQQQADEISLQVRSIIDEVRRQGDASLIRYAREFDHVVPPSFDLKVGAAEFDAAEADYLKILQHDQNNAIALANLATIELQQGKLDEYFQSQVFPVLTPLAFDPGQKRGVEGIGLGAIPALAGAHPLPLFLRGLFHGRLG